MLTAVVEGSQTDVGSSVNAVTSYKVMRDGADVTGNYTFGTSVNGTLTVSKRPVTLTSRTDTKVYDGSALTNSDVTVGGSGFVTGEGAAASAPGAVSAGGPGGRPVLAGGSPELDERGGVHWEVVVVAVRRVMIASSCSALYDCVAKIEGVATRW